MDDDANTASENVSSLNNINPTPMKARVSSRVAVSNCLKLELEKKFRRDLGRVHQAKKRKPLNYFAIYGAFQRAARERNASLSVDRMDTECLATGL
ncbi:TPA: hypothetical protein N0F65_009304 [Lagenidium giganteum]|uniref:Uncharacterized protein n=1 Tax=Lagenidium giganteum TaxID=4803 RepID=A0AAV2YQE5_9STRA|nr:TPA: hypothetical protein N0F65_009304 [Lagenidium giganteum]